ncbi:MAG: N-carbamoyl-D-amino-acid hydrolase [Planctomycetaceae bacterium]|nr:N-carbamoyl-D-amino-acid hydrolase [Planctomycetaceae bacterium]
MSRIIKIAAAQSGPVPLSQSREDVVERLIEQMRSAKSQDCDLIVFTECVLTAFFPHWWIEDEDELDSYFETQMPSPITQPLFDEAARLKIGFQLGYAELAFEDGNKKRFNSSVLVGDDGQIIGKFRKVHLPGHRDHRPDNPFQNLEKRYFEFGDLGFPTWRAFGGVVGMCICNGRRWSETYRALSLQGAELITLGFNTPGHHPEFPHLDELSGFHHLLCMQAGAYQNGAWVVAVSKAGEEEGVHQIGHTCIIAPSGKVVAESKTLEDELVVHACDLDETIPYKEYIFNYEKNRRIEHYGIIASQTSAAPPSS